MEWIKHVVENVTTVRLTYKKTNMPHLPKSFCKTAEKGNFIKFRQFIVQ
jgi:hypothetical protein